MSAALLVLGASVKVAESELVTVPVKTSVPALRATPSGSGRGATWSAGVGGLEMVVSSPIGTISAGAAAGAGASSDELYLRANPRFRTRLAPNRP